jgi:hypothetical protein
MLTLGAAARHCGVSKGTISKAIASGKLSATRREDGFYPSPQPLGRLRSKNKNTPAPGLPSGPGHCVSVQSDIALDRCSPSLQGELIERSRCCGIEVVAAVGVRQRHPRRWPARLE